MAETHTLDAVSEDSTNTAVELHDAANGVTVISAEYPVAAKDLVTAGSISTEGDAFVTSKPKNREITYRVRVAKSTHALLETAIGTIAQKVAKLAREGGTLKRVTSSARTIVFDILDAELDAPTGDWQYALAKNVEVTLKFLAKPYGRGAEAGATTTDAFASDSIGSGLWALDAGTGTISVTGGLLVPSTNAVKQLYRTDVTVYDSQLTLKFTTGATLNTQNASLLPKRIDATNYLKVAVYDDGGTHSIFLVKSVAGVETSLGSAAISALATNTSYWMRARLEGNKLAGEFWTSAPAQGAAPATTATYTLSGAEATTFGLGVSGRPGIRIESSNALARYDDFSVDPNNYYERTSPVLVTAPMYGIGGDVAANTRLVINEENAADQWMVLVGLQSRYIDTTTQGGLFFEAEALTAQGGSATAAGPTGASGSGSNVMRSAALATSYVSILSTQLTGGGAHLSHIGDFRVFARVQAPTANTGALSVALQWGQGDFRKFTTNTPITFPADEWDAQWLLLDLGLVHIDKATSGTQRWEGRILAKSSIAGDKIDVDHLFLLPVSEGASATSAVPQVQTPGSFSAHDEFDQTAGNLGGKTLPVGGTWATSGDANDIQVETSGKTAQRTDLSDTGAAGGSPGVGRIAIAGSTSLTNTVVQVDLKTSQVNINDVEPGVIARRVDASNYLHAILVSYTSNPSTGGFGSLLALYKVVAGTETGLRRYYFPLITASTWYTLRMLVDASGRAFVWFGPQGSVPSTPVIIHQDSVLATGGTLASGTTGFFDRMVYASPATTRNYDNFLAYAPVADAAVFASQSLEIRSDRARREDSGGTLWVEPSSVEGSYLRLPPAGREGRQTRTLVKGVRGPELASGVWADSAIDDISARHYPTPRYLVVPEA